MNWSRIERGAVAAVVIAAVLVDVAQFTQGVGLLLLFFIWSEVRGVN